MSPPLDTKSDRRLEGRRVLVVEDEMILALDLSDIVESFGSIVVVAARVSKALAALKEARFDCAVLDLNLGGEMVYPVAVELDRLGIPYLFTTGYGADGLAPEFHSRTVIAKPYTQSEVFAGLLKLAAPRAS